MADLVTMEKLAELRKQWSWNDQLLRLVPRDMQIDSALDTIEHLWKENASLKERNRKLEAVAGLSKEFYDRMAFIGSDAQRMHEVLSALSQPESGRR